MGKTIGAGGFAKVKGTKEDMQRHVMTRRECGWQSKSSISAR